MSLINETQHATLVANGLAARDAARAGLAFDPKPVVKLFSPTPATAGSSPRSIPTTRDAPTVFAIPVTGAHTWVSSV